MSRECEWATKPHVKDCHQVRIRDKEISELKDLLFEAFNQRCQISWDKEKKEGTYDHCFESTWEEIQGLLLDWGKIRLDQCIRK